MNPNYDILTILRIAKYYYIDGLNQQEIANKENIHRTQISRLLKQAREEGYVEIRISAPDSRSADTLAREIQARLGLLEVYVTPALSAVPASGAAAMGLPAASQSPSAAGPESDQSESLYFFAARRLETILPASGRIGIGVGKTMYHIASQLSAQKTDHPMEFYSLAGYSGSDNPYLQSSIITDRFARPFGGTCHYNNFPILLNQDAMSPLDRERYEAFVRACDSLDTVILSIGGPFSRDYPYFEEFSLPIKKFDLEKAFSTLHANLLGHVFYEDGSRLHLPPSYMLTSMNPEQLRKIPQVILIAGGAQKIPPILGAARQGYFNSLITDKQTAIGLLAALDGEKQTAQPEQPDQP